MKKQTIVSTIVLGVAAVLILESFISRSSSSQKSCKENKQELLQAMKTFYHQKDKGEWQHVRQYFADSVLVNNYDLTKNLPFTTVAEHITSGWQGYYDRFNFTWHDLHNPTVSWKDGRFVYTTDVHLVHHEPMSEGGNEFHWYGQHEYQLEERNGKWAIVAYREEEYSTEGNGMIPGLATLYNNESGSVAVNKK
jgi:SnoaL-like domain